MLKNRSLLTVGLILFLAAAYFYQDPGWNGNSRLNLTRAIVEHGSLQIDQYHSLTDWYTEDVAYYNGHYYCDKGIGSSLFAVPFYFVLYKFAAAFGLTLGSAFIKHTLTSLVLGAALAVNGMVMFLVAEKLGANPRRALIATLAVGLGTMLWPYSAVYYGHVLAAALLILAFYLLFSMRDAPTGSLGRIIGAGAAMGFAFITEYTSALIIVGLLLYAVYVLRGRDIRTMFRLALAGTVTALIPISMMFAYNYGVFGNPLDLGYAHEASTVFQKGMSAGLMGIHFPPVRSVLIHITLDPKFGIFWLSPVLILSPIGFWVALKQPAWRAEGLLSGYAIAVMLIMNAGYYLWWGGYAFGPRLIIPCLSFFIVPLALLPGILDLPALLLTVVSIGQMLIPLMGSVQMSVDFKQRLGTFFVAGSEFKGFSILYDHGLPLIAQKFAAGKASWTLGSAIGLPYWLTVPLLLILESALVFLFVRHASCQQPAAAHVAEAVHPAD